MKICVGVVVLLAVGVDILESYMGSSSISSRCSVSNVYICMGSSSISSRCSVSVVDMCRCSSFTRCRCRVGEVEGYNRVV